MPRRRPGPRPRFSQEQLVEAAVAIVDEAGFARLSLRAVARRLDVTPMALYTYVRSSEELVTLVVDRLVEQKAAGLVLPDGWQDTLRTFAANLAELLREHPAMLHAYAEGVVTTAAAFRVADSVLARLAAGGLAPAEAVRAYHAVQLVVLGFVLVLDAPAPPVQPADLARYPAVGAHVDALRHLTVGNPVAELVELVIAGVAARHDAGSPRGGDGEPRPVTRQGP